MDEYNKNFQYNFIEYLNCNLNGYSFTIQDIAEIKSELTLFLQSLNDYKNYQSVSSIYNWIPRKELTYPNIHPHHRVIVDTIKKFKYKSVIEFGAGAGQVSKFVYYENPQIENLTCVEYNDRHISQLRENFITNTSVLAPDIKVDANIVEESIHNLSDLKDNSFEIGYTCTVTMHIPFMVAIASICEMARICKNIIHVENQAGCVEKGLTTSRKQHFRIDYPALYEKLGFKIIQSDLVKDLYADCRYIYFHATKKMTINTNIPLFKVFMSPNISKPVTNTLLSGFITQGPKIEEFEKKLIKYFNHPWILTLNSATSGLTLALRLLKDQLQLTDSDEVLCTALTCTATNWPVLANGLRIKWVDVDPETCNMDLDDLKNKLSPKTKVILFVHWGGYPVDLTTVKAIQDYAQLKFGTQPLVVEDCAHAFGAKYKDNFLGTHGNIAIFSLQAIKHLTTGDGGLIFLPTEELYQKAKLLRWFGIDREKRSGGGDFRLEPDISDWGYKFHMNDINATIGIENLKYISKNLEIIRGNAEFYFKELNNVVGLPQNSRDRIASWWIFTITVKNKPEFTKYMKECGITVSQVHGRNDKHSCVSELASSLPQLDKLEPEIVAIPVGWWVTNMNREYIVKCIKKFYPH